MNNRAQLAAIIVVSGALIGANVGAAPTALAARHAPKHKGTLIASRSVGSFGRVLSNSKGRLLYLYDKDSKGTSHCNGGCVSAWPRVMSKAKPRAGSHVKAGHLGRTASHQVTYFGHPLYYFVGDPKTSHTGEGENGFYLVSTGGKAR